MKIRQTNFNGRKGWLLENGALSLVMLQGGGHIASATLATHPGINPLWVPAWKSMEPWHYDARKHQKQYELKLLSAICGHNLCLGWFGDPSETEARQGLECHGEASVARWTLKRKSVSKTVASLTVGCELPVAQMQVRRTLKSRAGSKVVYVEERVRNTSKRDLPFTMCQHVTVA
ncbi:MAG: hypothetical protein O3C57_07345, partial [Verrucomicrobia bacterium]|nr:hypothetical protein [Verrucomicrobiota bacterium]